MATYSALPANLNLALTVGDDFTLSLTVTENGSPWVATGATLATDIIDSSGAVVATDFTTAASTGSVTLSLTDTQTGTLGVGVYSYRLSVTKSSLTRDWIAGTLSIVEAGVGGSSTSSASLSISNSAVTLSLTSLVAPAAANISVTDTGGYFTGTDAETVLAEIGAQLPRTASPGVTATGDSNGRPTYPQLVAIGDSLTANNQSATAWTGVSLSRTHGYRADGYLARAMVVARQPCSWHQVGVSGETTTDMLARFDTDVTALRPQIVLEAGGSNDVRSGVSAATIFANKVAMWEKAFGFGAKVIATTVPPASDSSSAERNTCNQVNAWIREYARTNSTTFALVDWFPDMVDPLTGGVTTSVMDTSGVHPNTQGAYNMASKFANAILQFTGYPADPLPSDNVEDLDNFMDLPLLTGTTGSGSGGWAGVNASGWFCSGPATTSKVARSDGLGEWLQMACTGAGATNLKTTATRWAVGDYVYAACEFETDSSGWVDGVVTIKLLCFAADGSTALHFSTALTNGADTTTLGRHSSGVLRTPIIQIPATTSSLRVDLQKVNAGTVRFGRVEVRKLTT